MCHQLNVFNQFRPLVSSESFDELAVIKPEFFRETINSAKSNAEVSKNKIHFKLQLISFVIYFSLTMILMIARRRAVTRKNKIALHKLLLRWFHLIRHSTPLRVSDQVLRSRLRCSSRGQNPEVHTNIRSAQVLTVSPCSRVMESPLKRIDQFHLLLQSSMHRPYSLLV